MAEPLRDCPWELSPDDPITLQLWDCPQCLTRVRGQPPARICPNYVVALEARHAAVVRRLQLVEDPPHWLQHWLTLAVSRNARCVAAHMMGGSTLVAAVFGSDVPTPRDTSDVGATVYLLDQAQHHGLDWTSRMPELTVGYRQWAPLHGYWPRIEAAFYRDVQAQRAAWIAHDRAAWWRKDGLQRLTRRRSGVPLAPMLPPSECWWLLAHLYHRAAPIGPLSLTADHPDATGGGLWRPLADTSPAPMEVPCPAP